MKEIDTLVFHNAFLSLLIREYKTTTLPPPDAMRAANKVWMDVDDETIMGKLLTTFELTNSIDDFTPNEVFAGWLKEKNAGGSVNKLYVELRRHLATLDACKSCNIENKTKRQNETTRRG